MCGIVGYVGHDGNAVDVLIDGLRRLEYRGYDSAGVAIFERGEIRVSRALGKLANLEAALRDDPLPGSSGIGHTRWATHGRPSERNAHPHRAGGVVLVHNGIIENYRDLRTELEAGGREILSETDSELIAHLIDVAVQSGEDLLTAVRTACGRLQGSYAFAALCEDAPDTLVAAKHGGSPIILGVGEGATYLGSDIPALLPHTRQMIFIEDGDYAVLSTEGIQVVDSDGRPVDREVKPIQWDPISAEKGGYDRFMQKEIFEQPRAIVDTLGTRISDGSLDLGLRAEAFSAEALAKVDRLCLTACGTAYYSCLVGKYFYERFARIPVEVDLASEFRYRQPIVDSGVLTIPVSQSGETADTLAALREAKEAGSHVLAICNSPESTIVRESHDVFYTYAGPEIGVASTKCFMTQLVAHYLLALHLGICRGLMDPAEADERLRALQQLPRRVEEVLLLDAEIRRIAQRFFHARNFLFLGRGVMHPIALEGALKLKEISYIHAEGYAAGEMKHGPIALIDEDMPVLVIANRSAVYDKLISNLEQVRSRDGVVIAVATEGDVEIAEKASEVIYIPDLGDELTAMLAVVPLQLLAYHVAVLKGTDVDQPRNLAKSVTVE